MSDQLQDPWDEIEAEMRGALLGGKIPLLGDCQRHQREIWRHAPCPMCERDAVIGRLTAVLDAARPICLRWETRGLGPNLPGEKPTDAELLDMLCEKVRALDGTNPTHLSTSVEVFVQPCPTCGREAHDAG